MRRSYCIVRTSGRRSQHVHHEQIFAADSPLEAYGELSHFREANPGMKVELKKWPLGFSGADRKEGLVYETEGVTP